MRHDVDEEIREHIALRAEQLEAEGLDRASALEEARRRFAMRAETMRGLYDAALERNRHTRMTERWASWWQDVRYAARGLARDRLLAGFVVVALTLGIGVNVTAFSLLDRLLLRDPPHIQAPRELVRLYGTVTTAVSGERTSSWIPYPAYQQLSEAITGFERVGAYRVTEQIVGRGMAARKLRVGQVLGDFFGTLGITPLRGRYFAATEDEATAGRLAVVGEAFWQGMLSGDPSVIGQPLVVGEATYQVIGIAPAGFTGTELRRVDIWLLGDTRRAGSTNWNIVGRLRAGTTQAGVSAEAAAVHARTSETSPDWFREANISAGPIRFDDTGREPFEVTMARWLTGISLVILFVALGNVVNLLLARSARRRRELAVRVALGSGRARLIRLLSLEGGLLAVAAGVLSLVVVRTVEPLVRGALLAGDAPWTLTLLDLRLLGMLAGVMLLTGFVVGVVPAVQAGTTKLAAVLRDETQGGVRGARVRAGLTVLQAALSVVLLVGAGLFVRSMARIDALDLGIDRDRTMVVRAELPPLSRFTQAAVDSLMQHERRVFQLAVEAVRALPGVERAAVAVGLPLDGGSFSAGVHVPGRDSVPSLPGGGPFASAVGTDYFAAIGTPLLRGRPFDDGDVAGSEAVIIVNETMARALWPDSDALDRCVRVGSAAARCARVVGIAADVHRVGLREQSSLQYYLPLEQQTMFGGATLVVRPTVDSPVSPAALRQTVLASDPSFRIAEPQPLRQALDGEMRPLRLGTVAFGLSSSLALVVAVLGLYSVMAYMVAWRTREIGVRVALGATRAQIGRLVIGTGGRLAATGVAAGLVLAAIGGRRLEPHLFLTSATDPIVFGTVAIVLLGVALLAGWLPARRATRIDPTEALRA